MRRILFVGWYPNPVDKYRNVFFQNLIFEMARQGVDCTVISPVSVMKYKSEIIKIPDYIEEKVSEGIFVHTYFPKTLSASSKQIGWFNTEKISEALFEKTALRCAKKIDVKFDCVYGHFFLYGGLAANRIARELQIPSYIAYGECDFESQVNATYGVPKPKEINGLKGIISVSTKNTKELEEIGFVKNVPVITAPNSTDLSLFYKRDKKESRKKFGMPEDKFIVGFVGGFIDRKGDKRLLAAINLLDEVYVAYAGRGDNPPTGEKVVFCNALEHDKIPEFLSAIDVFCLPTLNEGSCNAIVEAMACGCPVISSDLPFNDDFLNDVNSIRINPLSVEEISKAIEWLYTDEEKLKEMSALSLEMAKKCSIDYRAKRILDFIYDT